MAVKNYFNKLKSYWEHIILPDYTSVAEEFMYWREKILRSLLEISVLAGFFVVIPTVIFQLKEGLWPLAILLVACYVSTVFLFFNKKLGYRFKALFLVVLGYAMGLGILISTGLVSGGPLWLFAWAVLAGLLLGKRAAIVGVLINLLIFIGIVIFVITESADQLFVNFTSSGKVILAGISFILLNALTAMAVSVLISEMEKVVLEQSYLYKALKTSQEKLEKSKKIETIGLMAGGVAHDLNNVLAGIVSYPDLLLLKLEQDSPLKKPILTIKESGLKAAAIVQDLLALARRGVLVFRVIDLNDIVSKYLSSPEHSKIMTFHPGVQLRTDLSNNAKYIKGSAPHLKKIIMNLVSNGAEACKSGGVIRIKTESINLIESLKGFEMIPKGKYTRLSVSDNGMGIEERELAHIFEPFYSKKSLDRSGTGLGLTVVWSTVHDHFGYIDTRSSTGEGSDISLYFPETSEDIKEEVEEVINQRLGDGKTILVVDDEEDQREILSDILKQFEFSVDTASSGEKAVDYMKKNKPDIILLDMIMNPGIDGLETYKQIRKINPGQRVIIISGYSETERVIEAQKLGVKAYLKKPYLINDLIKVLESFLQ